MTRINEDVAMRRFHQGLFYLIGAATKEDRKIEGDTVLAVTSVMAYLGAYAYPGGNLYDLKQVMKGAFEPLKSKMDIETTIDRAIEIAEVFRRPWTEPGAQGESTI